MRRRPGGGGRVCETVPYRLTLEDGSGRRKVYARIVEEGGRAWGRRLLRMRPGMLRSSRLRRPARHGDRPLSRGAELVELSFRWLPSRSSTLPSLLALYFFTAAT